MRYIALMALLCVTVALPAPMAADHDSGDAYTTIPIGDGWYVDDNFPRPMIFRETNEKAGLQRPFDSSGHAGHGNPDERVF